MIPDWAELSGARNSFWTTEYHFNLAAFFET